MLACLLARTVTKLFARCSREKAQALSLHLHATHASRHHHRGARMAMKVIIAQHTQATHLLFVAHFGFELFFSLASFHVRGRVPPPPPPPKKKKKTVSHLIY